MPLLKVFCLFFLKVIHFDTDRWDATLDIAVPKYTFMRNATNTTFATSDGLTVKPNDSNVIPTIVKNDDPFVTPTIGLFVGF